MRKDVDLMRETGGNKKHKYLTKPHRKDLSKNTLSETDPDAKDVKKDPDMKLNKIAYKIIDSYLRDEK